MSKSIRKDRKGKIKSVKDIFDNEVSDNDYEYVRKGYDLNFKNR